MKLSHKKNEAKFQPRVEMITIRGYGRHKAVSALLVGERVAVHAAWLECGYAISDPVTGLAYHWSPGWSAITAQNTALRFVRRFGSNPLKGMSVSKDMHVLRKPHGAAKMGDWFRKLKAS